MSLADRLSALHDLHLRGLLTDAEFALAKRREIEAAGRPALAAVQPVAPPPPAAPRPAPRTLNPVVPGVGLALGAAAVANGGLTG